MKPQIAHTCIVANYQTTYDLLDVVPTESNMAASREKSKSALFGGSRAPRNEAIL
jgi:hypothetical protein